LAFELYQETLRQKILLRLNLRTNFGKLKPGRILCVDLREFGHAWRSLICPIESLLCRLKFPVLFSIKQGRRTEGWLWNGILSEFNGNCSAGDRLNSLYFSLLQGIWQENAVPEQRSSATQSWVAEKLGCIPLQIAGNPRNSTVLALKPDRRKCPAESRRQVLQPFFSARQKSSPVSTTASGECNAITSR